MDYIAGYGHSLWKYMLISAPYLLVGLLVAGVMNQFLPIATVRKHLGGKQFSGILKAALFGIPLPLCSCAVVPTAVTLRKNGAGNGATSSFLVATPESGVDSIAMTYALMDLPMTILRPIVAFISAFVAGTLQFFFNEYELSEEDEGTKSCCKKAGASQEQKPNVLMSIFKFGYVTLINDMALWLAFGIFVGAGIDLLVPENFFEQLNPSLAKLAILAVGIPVYICASATTPIAASLIIKGMSPGAAILLLLVGPATNVSNLAIIQKYIGKKGVILNIIAISITALIASYVVDFLYQALQWPLDFKLGHSHMDDLSAPWRIICGVILSILITKGIIQENILPRLKRS